MSLFKRLFGKRESSLIDPVFGTLHVEVIKDIYGKKQSNQTYYGFIVLDRVEVKIILKDYHVDSVEGRYELFRFIQVNFDQFKEKLIPFLKKELERALDERISGFNYDEDMVFQKLMLPACSDLETAKWSMQFYHLPTDCFFLVDMLHDEVLTVHRVD